MLVRSVVIDGAFSLSAYVKVFAAPSQYLGSLARTFSLALSVTLIAVALGVAFGVLLAKTDLPLRGTFTVLFAVPLCLPPYVLALSWSSLMGRNGLLPSQWANW